MFTVKFWKETAERAAKTAAQAVILFWGAGEMFDLFSVDWQASLGFALGGAALSVLTSIVSAPIGSNPESPSVL